MRAQTVLFVSPNPDFGPMYEWALKRAGLWVRVLKQVPSKRHAADVAVIHLLPCDDARNCAAELRRRLSDGVRLIALTSYDTDHARRFFDAVALLPVLPEALVRIVRNTLRAPRGYRVHEREGLSALTGTAAIG
jgi:hypothetical protein